jgi:hypothetical protein
VLPVILLKQLGTISHQSRYRRKGQVAELSRQMSYCEGWLAPCHSGVPNRIEFLCHRSGSDISVVSSEMWQFLREYFQHSRNILDVLGGIRFLVVWSSYVVCVE